MVKELLATTVDLQNPIDTLNKFTLRKTLRILRWINRFLNNCKILFDKESKTCMVIRRILKLVDNS